MRSSAVNSRVSYRQKCSSNFSSFTCSKELTTMTRHVSISESSEQSPISCHRAQLSCYKQCVATGRSITSSTRGPNLRLKWEKRSQWANSRWSLPLSKMLLWGRRWMLWAGYRDTASSCLNPLRLRWFRPSGKQRFRCAIWKRAAATSTKLLKVTQY